MRARKKDEDQSLELVGTDELLIELSRRFHASAFVGVQKPTKRRKNVVHELNGPYDDQMFLWRTLGWLIDTESDSEGAGS